MTELTSMILSMTDVSKSAVKVSALVNFIAGEFRIPVRIDDGADDLVTMIGIDIFSKIVLDILEYMLQLESLFQKKEEVKIKIVTTNSDVSNSPICLFPIIRIVRTVNIYKITVRIKITAKKTPPVPQVCTGGIYFSRLFLKKAV